MSFTHQRPFVVSVEGNIGSGKSTMLRYFEKMDSNVTVLAEPVTDTYIIDTPKKKPLQMRHLFVRKMI